MQSVDARHLQGDVIAEDIADSAGYRHYKLGCEVRPLQGPPRKRTNDGHHRPYDPRPEPNHHTSPLIGLGRGPGAAPFTFIVSTPGEEQCMLPKCV